MICLNESCGRRAPALYPDQGLGGVCVDCFDFEAYAKQPLPVVRNADVNREKLLKSKRDCYHRRQFRLKTLMEGGQA